MSSPVNFNNVGAVAIGLWKYILSSLGIEAGYLRNKPGPCPACGGRDRFRFDDKGGTGSYFCNQCGHGDGFTLLEKVYHWTPTEALHRVAGLLGISADKPLSREEVAANKKRVADEAAKHEAKRLAERDALAAKALAFINAGQHPPFEHRYLSAKGLAAQGDIRLAADGNTLLIPLYDIDGTLWAVQHISYKDGKWKKEFKGKNGGCFHIIAGTTEKVCIVEGFATGLSVHLATGCMVACAMAGNQMRATASAVNDKYPIATIVACGDDDAAGRKAVADIASAVDYLMAYPDFGMGRPQGMKDFDDLRQLKGLEAVRACIETAASLPPEPAANDNMVPEGTEAEISHFDADGKKATQGTVLIEMAQHLELFHDAYSTGYAIVVKDGVRHVFEIRSKAFKEYLSLRYYRAFCRGVSSKGMQDAIDTIDSRARFDGDERETYVRVAAIKTIDETTINKIYLDLCDSAWRVVEITPSGWQLLNQSPVMFIRNKNMRALPAPMCDGSVESLRKFVNVTDEQWPLIYAWLLAALRGCKPFPVLVLQAEQGCGKSTSSQAIKDMIDPAAASLLSPPRDVDDLRVNSLNAYVLAYDNLSGLRNDISDALCRTSTGGSNPKRKLFTDSEQESADQVRPVIVNGIDDIAVRSDFSSRVLQADLPLLPDKSKAGEEGLWGEYYRERPMILGALLDMTAAAMRGFAAEPISPNGRFKDLQRWVAAAERGTDMPQGFMNAYKAGTDNAVIHAVEASAFASAILRLVEQRGKWSGTATELLNELDDKVDDRTRKSRGWPQTSRAVKNAVARAAPNLRVVGVECAHKKSGSRTIYLDRLGKLSPKTLISPKPGNGTDSKPGDTSSDMGDENKELGDGQEDMHGISPTCKSISYAALGDTDDLGDKKPPQANCIHSKQNNATDTDWVEGEM